MKTPSPAIRLFLLASILFSASCAAPTPLPTASQTPPATQTSTPTATQTTTPTEIPLPEGPISELQKKLGDKYKLTQEGDHYIIDGVDNLKFNEDGTTQLAYGGEDLTISFQAISAENEALQIGPWQNKDGEWTMLTAPAPKTVEDADSFPKFAYLEGHAKEKEIDLTIHKYVQMATAETAASEFDNIYVDGKKIDVAVPTYWQSWSSKLEGMEYIYLESSASYNPLIVLGQGYANLAVYDVFGNLKLKSKILPMLIRDTDGLIYSRVGLVDDSYFSKMLKFLGEERRTDHIAAILIKTATSEPTVHG